MNKIAWDVAGKDVIGAAHKRAGVSCQDAICYKKDENYIVLAVADGHGSTKCPYSDEGAISATNVAVEVLTQLYEEYHTNLKALERVAKEKLAETLIRHWRETIKIIHNKQQREVKPVEQMALLYGTTLSAVLITKKFVLFFQIGDGDILVVQTDGTIVRPMPEDDKLFANETTSLCTPTAWKDARIVFHSLHNQDVELILVMTDGYANSFACEKDFLEISTEYLTLIKQQGLDYIATKLEEWLTETSADGCGDDITLGIIYRFESLPNDKI